MMTAPNRWTDVGRASVKYQWSRDQEGNDPPTDYGHREAGDHYSPTMLGTQPEVHQIFMINESEAGSAAPSRAPSQGP
eukprot:15227-Pyramimonas_sp.AAC.1